MTWAIAWRRKTDQWPRVKSGRIPGTTERWSRVDEALRKGFRGLPGGSSLARLLAGRRQARGGHVLNDSRGLAGVVVKRRVVDDPFG